MPTATVSVSGRRYRGLSAEERRADQRERLVRAAINEFSVRGYHRTSVEDIVRSAHTSRTAFYTFFDNREDAMYAALQASLSGLLDAVRMRTEGGDARHAAHRGRRHRVRQLPRVGSGRRVHPLARRHRNLAGGQRAAGAGALPGCRPRTRDLSRPRRARERIARKRPRSRSARSASCSSRCCTLWRAAGSTRRPSHIPVLITAVERMLAPVD